MVVSLTVKRQPAWANFGTTGWSVSLTPSDLGFEDPPYSPARSAFIALSLRLACATQAAHALRSEGIITQDECDQMVNPIKRDLHLMEEQHIGNLPGGKNA